MSEHSPTIFDKILAGEIPCHRVYEDDHVYRDTVKKYFQDGF